MAYIPYKHRLSYNEYFLKINERLKMFANNEIVFNKPIKAFINGKEFNIKSLFKGKGNNIFVADSFKIEELRKINNIETFMEINKRIMNRTKPSKLNKC